MVWLSLPVLKPAPAPESYEDVMAALRGAFAPPPPPQASGYPSGQARASSDGAAIDFKPLDEVRREARSALIAGVSATCACSSRALLDVSTGGTGQMIAAFS